MTDEADNEELAQELEKVKAHYATKDQYQLTQELILTTVRTITMLPLVPFVNAANRAETIGPIADPTLYREASSRLSKIKRFAEILLTAQRDIAVVHEEIKKELAKEEGRGASPPNPGPQNGETPTAPEISPGKNGA